jgi:proline iminopeptidase
MLRLLRRIVCLVVWFMSGASAVGAQSLFPPPVPNRDYITARLADLRKISTPEGIDTLERLDIAGSQQWISIRGLNRNNPVLLFIHGGPGAAMMGSAWAYQTPWEDFFTVVHWEQRGAGKNHATADTTALSPTMTMERMISDAEAVVAHLRRTLRKDKIVVMGFSFGTVLGVHLAKQRPEWISAYVGVGQAIATEDEAYLYQRVLAMARQAKNDSAVRELEALAPYPAPAAEMTNAKVVAVRKWVRVFNGGWYGRSDFKLWFALPDWAPEYTSTEVEAFMRGVRWSGEQLVPAMMSDDLNALGYDFKVPMIFLMGRYDLHTPYEMARQYHAKIRAPHKAFVSFERSAHFPMFEEPGRFLLALVQEVLPHAGPRVTFAREP